MVVCLVAVFSSSRRWGCCLDYASFRRAFVGLAVCLPNAVSFPDHGRRRKVWIFAIATLFGETQKAECLRSRKDAEAIVYNDVRDCATASAEWPGGQSMGIMQDLNYAGEGYKDGFFIETKNRGEERSMEETLRVHDAARDSGWVASKAQECYEQLE